MPAVRLFGSASPDQGEPSRELKVSVSGSHKKSGEAFLQGFAAFEPLEPKALISVVSA